MSETQSTAAVRIGSLFDNGSTQTGFMVAAVTAISQAFARDDVHAAVGANPVWVAIGVSALFAIYQVRLYQRARIAECVVLIPLVAAIVFGLALGANNLIAAQVGSEPDPALEAEIRDATEQLGRLNALRPGTAADAVAASAARLPARTATTAIASGTGARPVFDGNGMRPARTTPVHAEVERQKTETEQRKALEVKLELLRSLKAKRQTQSVWKKW
ncbi:MAG: hypothetical protein KDG50_09020 [Chromatiales bacterium]|nr:hypothetical protein [Chromatiales bacterium]